MATGSSDSGGGQLARFHWTALDSVTGDFLGNNPVTTTSDSLLVNNASDPVTSGSNRYQLVVEDDSGNLSDPVQIVIHVGNTPPVATVMIPTLNTRAGGVTVPAHTPLNYPVEPVLLSSNLSLPRHQVVYGQNFVIQSGVSDAAQTPSLTLLNRDVPITIRKQGKDFEIDVVATPLPVGQYDFRMTIFNSDGSYSVPMLIPVSVVDGAIITPPGYGNDYRIEEQTDFSLAASVSPSIPSMGTISQYIWNIVDTSSGLQVFHKKSALLRQDVINSSGKIPAGAYRIELILEDDTGKQSKPFTSPLYITNSSQSPDNLLFSANVLDQYQRVAPGNRIISRQNFYLQASAKSTGIQRWHWSALDAPAGNLPAGTSQITDTPSLMINAAENPLPAGVYRYQVAAEDIDGLVSAPLTFSVHVLDSGAANSPINLAADDDFTLSMWVKPGSLIDNMALFAQETDQIDSHRFVIQSTAAGGISAGFDRFGTGWDSIVTGGGAIKSGQWAFIGVTRSGNSVNIYVNGNLLAQGSLSTALGATSGTVGHFIGQFAKNPDPYADALISEVSLHNRALTEAEIRTRMLSRLRGDEDDLLAYWPLNETDGSIVRDLAGKEHGVLSVGFTEFAWADSPFSRVTGRIGEPVRLYLGGSDADGDTLTARVTTLPSSGKLFQADGVTPILAGDTVADSRGLALYIAERTRLDADSLGFVVNDGIDDSAEKTVTISLPNVRPIAGGAPVNGLAAYYPFTDAASGLAQDASGRGNHGVNINAFAVRDHSGGNTAYSFGSSGYLDMGDVDRVEDIDELTISAWINTQQFPSPDNNPDRNRNAIASKWVSGGSSNNNSFLMSDVGPVQSGEAGGRLQLLVSNNSFSGRGLAAAHNMPTAQWQHVAVVFRNGIEEVFVNGQSIGTTDLYYQYLQDTVVGPIKRIPASTTALLIGSWRPELGYPSFKGALDEIRFYDRALLPTEIQQLYHHDGYSKTAVNNQLTLTLTGFDADNDALSFRITSLPVNGNLFDLDGITPLKVGDVLKSKSSNQAQLVYTSSTPGLDDFGFVVNDGQSDSLETRYSIEVTAE